MQQCSKSQYKKWIQPLLATCMWSNTSIQNKFIISESSQRSAHMLAWLHFVMNTIVGTKYRNHCLQRLSWSTGIHWRSDNSVEVDDVLVVSIVEFDLEDTVELGSTGSVYEPYEKMVCWVWDTFYVMKRSCSKRMNAGKLVSAASRAATATTATATTGSATTATATTATAMVLEPITWASTKEKLEWSEKNSDLQ